MFSVLKSRVPQQARKRFGVYQKACFQGEKQQNTHTPKRLQGVCGGPLRAALVHRFWPRKCHNSLRHVTTISDNFMTKYDPGAQTIFNRIIHHRLQLLVRQGLPFSHAKQVASSELWGPISCTLAAGPCGVHSENRPGQSGRHPPEPAGLPRGA